MTKEEIKETKQGVLYMCRVTFKGLAFTMVLGYGFLYAFLMVPAHAADLKTESIVNAPVIHVSDIFFDVPATKDVVLGNAPAPGQTMILDARTLKRVANIYDIDWKPASAADQVVLRRTSQTITAEDMIAALKANLAAKGVSGDFGITLNNAAPSVVIPGDVPATIEVAQISYTPGRDIFSATLASPNAANPVKTINVTGLIEKMTEVPVLKSVLKNGDIIGSADIEWVSVPARNMVRDTIIDADKLMGKTPLRMVDAGVPIRARDVMSPQLISRGDDVMINFVSSSMQLSAKGKAMQNGAEGDVIRVMNLSSNQPLQAEITGYKIVKVQ